MKRIVLFVLLGYAFSTLAFAQPQHFAFKANTGDSYSIVVTGAILNGVALNVGDEIGVFTPAQLCVGASVWTGTTPLALTAWVDDSQTQEADGYKAGETMSFRIWEQSNDTEFPATPTYAQGNGTFGNGAFASLSLAAVSGGQPSGLLVTNTNDSGAQSLREAIILANNNLEADTIRFAIPQSDPGFDGNAGTWTIQPLSPLPAITDSELVIDGSSQADFIGSDRNPDGPEIVINGSQAGSSANGLQILSSMNVIQHLVINGFSFAGIFISGENAYDNEIVGNYIGTNAAGNDTTPNLHGIYVSDASGTVIGGSEPGSGNLLSGNRQSGLYMIGDETYDTQIIGNYIGTNASGDAALGNLGIGLSLFASDNIVGGSSEGEHNLISGNKADGIRIFGEENIVMGNYIGTDITGSAAIGNLWDGIALYGPNNVIGGAEPGEGNIISGNQRIGISFSNADSNDVIGNMIGSGKIVSEQLGNAFSGISMSSGSSDNTIGPSNIIRHNGTGVFVNLDSTLQNTITQNSISHNSGQGILTINGGNTGLSPPSNIQVNGSTVSGNAPPDAIVEIFSDDDDEGKIYEGTTTADANGNFQWNGTPTGPFVTATATDADGNTSQFSQPKSVTTVVETAELTIPEKFSLSQNYPNPFNPTTTINFAVPGKFVGGVKVSLKIFNIEGQMVRSLVDVDKSPGFYSVVWDGKSDQGEEVSSGVYFYTVSVGEFQATRKMILLQ